MAFQRGKEGSDNIRVRDSEKTMPSLIDCRTLRSYRSFGVKDTRRKELKR